MATIGVLPASGKASRIGGIPKFCLPISDERSLIQWHVEQMLEMCDEVRISTRSEWVPIIQNTKGWISDIINDYKLGFNVESNNPESMMMAIKLKLK